MTHKICCTGCCYFVLALLLLLVPIISHAQPSFNDNVADTPIDGGLSLLIAAGVGYGAKKLKEKNDTKHKI